MIADKVFGDYPLSSFTALSPCTLMGYGVSWYCEEILSQQTRKSRNMGTPRCNKTEICYEMVRQFLNFWGIFDHFDCFEQYQTSFLDVRLLSNDQFPRGSLYNNHFFFKLLRICKGSEGGALVIVIQFQFLDNHGALVQATYISFVYFKTGWYWETWGYLQRVTGDSACYSHLISIFKFGDI